jgi:DNA-binding IclR family transcriptional regulator
MPTVDMARRSTSPPYHVQVLDRTVLLLDTLAEAEGDLALSELTERLGLHRSTVHRLLMVLEHYHFVRRSASGAGYSLGMKLFTLGSRAVAQIRLRERSEPILRSLVEQTRETAHICILDGSETLSIANVEAPWVVRIPSTVGGRTPVHCTSTGKVLLAFLPDSARADLIARLPLTRYTERTIVTAPGLEAELSRVRGQGYAIDNQEREAGLRCIGVPVRNYTGRVVAAISIAGPAFRVTQERIPQLIEMMLTAAEDVSKSLGYTGSIPVGSSRPKRAVGPRADGAANGGVRQSGKGRKHRRTSDGKTAI